MIGKFRDRGNEPQLCILCMINRLGYC